VPYELSRSTPKETRPNRNGDYLQPSLCTEAHFAEKYFLLQKRGFGLILPFTILTNPQKNYKMPWLLQLLIDALIWLVPWGDRHTDRSIVGESRFDRQARWIAWILLFLIVASLLFYFLIFNK
jgi:hypothetical protein